MIQINMCKPNLIGTNFCLQNRQVVSLYRLNLQRFPALGLDLNMGLYMNLNS